METYENFKKMLDSLQKYRKYESFTSTDENGKAKVYDLYGKTATGLLRDAAVTTTGLSTKQKNYQRKITFDVFAAYCMHYCCLFLDGAGNEHLYNAAEETMKKTIEEIKNKIAKQLENGEPLKNIRVMMGATALKNVTNYLKKNGLDSDDDWVMSDNDTSDIDNIDRDILEEIMNQAGRGMIKESISAEISSALYNCQLLGKVTEDGVAVVCHSYQLGDGYKFMNDEELSEEFGKNTAEIQNLREETLDALYKYIEEDDYFKAKLLLNEEVIDSVFAN